MIPLALTGGSLRRSDYAGAGMMITYRPMAAGDREFCVRVHHLSMRAYVEPLAAPVKRSNGRRRVDHRRTDHRFPGAAVVRLPLPIERKISNSFNVENKRGGTPTELLTFR